MSFRNTNSSNSMPAQQQSSSNSRYHGTSQSPGRNISDSNHSNQNQNLQYAKRDLLQRKAKDKNEEVEESPATPDSTTEPPKPAHDFQEGDDVFFHTDEGQNMLGTIGQVTPFRCQVLFGDGTQQWAPHRRLKKLSCAVDEPAPLRAPPPLPSTRRRSTSTTATANLENTNINSLTASSSSSPSPSAPAPAPVAAAANRKNSSISITADRRASKSASVSHHEVSSHISKDKIEIICISCKSKKKMSPRKAAALNSQTPFKCTKCYVPGFTVGPSSFSSVLPGAGPEPGPTGLGQGQVPQGLNSKSSSSLSRQLIRKSSCSNTSNNNISGPSTVAATTTSTSSSSITNANQNTMSLSNFIKSSPIGGNLNSNNTNTIQYHQNQMTNSSGIIGSADLTVSRIPGPPASPPIQGGQMMSVPGPGGHGHPMKPNRTSVSVPLTSPSPIKTGKTSNLCFHCGTRTCPYDRVHCNLCERYCHLMCLALSPQPLEGDKFWDVMCSACGTQTATPGEGEGMSRVFSVRRSITSWSDVVHLIINCLKVKSLGQKYFDFDSQIIPFFDNNIDRLHLPRQYKLASIEDRKNHLLVALTSSRLRFSNHKGSSSSNAAASSTTNSEIKRAASNSSSIATANNSGSGGASSGSLGSTSASGTLWSIRTERDKNNKGGEGHSLPTPIAGGRPGSVTGSSVGKNLFSNISSNSEQSSHSFSQSDMSGSSSFSSDISISSTPPIAAQRGGFRSQNQHQSPTSSSSQPSALSIVPIGVSGGTENPNSNLGSNAKKSADSSSLPAPVSTSSPRVLSKEALLRNPMTTNIVLSPSKTPPITSFAKSQSGLVSGVRVSHPQRTATARTSTITAATSATEKEKGKEKQKPETNSTRRTESNSTSKSIHLQRLRVRIPLKGNSAITSTNIEAGKSAPSAGDSAASSSSSLVVKQCPKDKDKNIVNHNHKLQSLTLSSIPGRGVSRKRVISSDDEDSLLEEVPRNNRQSKPSNSGTSTGKIVSKVIGSPQDKTQIEVSMGRAIKSARMELLPVESRICSDAGGSSSLSVSQNQNQQISPPGNPRGRPKLLRSSVKNKLNANNSNSANNVTNSTTTAAAVSKNNVGVGDKIPRKRGRPCLNPGTNGNTHPVSSTLQTHTTSPTKLNNYPGSITSGMFSTSAAETNNSIFPSTANDSVSVSSGLFNEDSLTNDNDIVPRPQTAAVNDSIHQTNFNFMKDSVNFNMNMNSGGPGCGGGSGINSKGDRETALQNSLSRISNLHSILNKAGYGMGRLNSNKTASNQILNVNSESQNNLLSGSGVSGSDLISFSSLISEVNSYSNIGGVGMGNISSSTPTAPPSLPLSMNDRLSMTIFKANLINAALFGGLGFQCLPPPLRPLMRDTRVGIKIEQRDTWQKEQEMEQSQIAQCFLSEDLKSWISGTGASSAGSSVDSSDSETGNSNSNSNSNFANSCHVFSHWNPFNNNSSGNRRAKRKSSLNHVNSNTVNANASNSTSAMNLLTAVERNDENEHRIHNLPKKRNRFQKTLDDLDAYEIVARKIDIHGILRYQVVWRESMPEDSEMLDFDEEIENLFFRHEEDQREKERNNQTNSTNTTTKNERSDESETKSELLFQSQKMGHNNFSAASSENSGGNSNSNGKTNNTLSTCASSSTASPTVDDTSKLHEIIESKSLKTKAAVNCVNVNGLAIKVEKEDRDAANSKLSNNRLNPNNNKNQQYQFNRTLVAGSGTGAGTGSAHGQGLGKGNVNGKGQTKYVLGPTGIERRKSPSGPGLGNTAVLGQNQNQSQQSGFTSSCGSVSVSKVPCFIDLTTDSP